MGRTFDEAGFSPTSRWVASGVLLLRGLVGFGIHFERLASGSPDGGGGFEVVLVREYKCRPREV